MSFLILLAVILKKLAKAKHRLQHPQAGRVVKPIQKEIKKS